MSSGKPWVKWYGRDWLGDPLLRMVGPDARGVWMDLLCVMMETDPYGHLAVNGRPMRDEEAARLIGMDNGTYKGILYRLLEAGIPSKTPDGMLFSRRLVREHEMFKIASNAGKKGGGNPSLKGKKQEVRSHMPEARESIKVPYKDTFKGEYIEPTEGMGIHDIVKCIQSARAEFKAIQSVYWENTLKEAPDKDSRVAAAKSFLLNWGDPTTNINGTATGILRKHIKDQYPPEKPWDKIADSGVH